MIPNGFFFPVEFLAEFGLEYSNDRVAEFIHQGGVHVGSVELSAVVTFPRLDFTKKLAVLHEVRRNAFTTWYTSNWQPCELRRFDLDLKLQF